MLGDRRATRRAGSPLTRSEPLRRAPGLAPERPDRAVRRRGWGLTVEDLFDVADLFLDFAFSAIAAAFSAQIRISDRVARRFLELALDLFGRTFRLVLCA